MFERYTERARRVMFFARYEASQFGAMTIECERILAYSAEEAERLAGRLIGGEHLLLGMLREENCLAAKVLYELGLKPGVIREELARHPMGGETTSGVTSVGFFHPLSSFLNLHNPVLPGAGVVPD